MREKRRPGEVRDAIITVLSARQEGVPLAEIERWVSELIGEIAGSSVRSYLRLNTPEVFSRIGRGHYALRDGPAGAYARYGEDVVEEWPHFSFGKTRMVRADCFDWLRGQRRNSIHAVVTDPPYGLFEYSEKQQEKLRNGKGGVWRIPPSFDGSKRSPLPRFTILSAHDLEALEQFFCEWARLLLPVVVPGLTSSWPAIRYCRMWWPEAMREGDWNGGVRSCAS